MPFLFVLFECWILDLFVCCEGGRKMAFYSGKGYGRRYSRGGYKRRYGAGGRRFGKRSYTGGYRRGGGRYYGKFSMSRRNGGSKVRYGKSVESAVRSVIAKEERKKKMDKVSAIMQYLPVPYHSIGWNVDMAQHRQYFKVPVSGVVPRVKGSENKVYLRHVQFQFVVDGTMPSSMFMVAYRLGENGAIYDQPCENGLMRCFDVHSFLQKVPGTDETVQVVENALLTENGTNAGGALGPFQQVEFGGMDEGRALSGDHTFFVSQLKKEGDTRAVGTFRYFDGDKKLSKSAYRKSIVDDSVSQSLKVGPIRSGGKDQGEQAVARRVQETVFLDFTGSQSSRGLLLTCGADDEGWRNPVVVVGGIRGNEVSGEPREVGMLWNFFVTAVYERVE